MSYNSTTKIITAAVSIDDLKRCFQVVLAKTVSGTEQRGFSCDLGTIVKTETGDTVDGWTVSSRNNINKWAKFKPVKRTGLIDTVNQSEVVSGVRKWKTSSTWWQADNGMCGLVIPSYENLNALLIDYAAPHEMDYQYQYHWTYDRVSTGYYARMTDFLGYRHNATPAINNFMTDQKIYFKATGQDVTSDTNVVASIGFNVESYENGASLALADFGKNDNGIAECYFGVALIRGTAGVVNGVMNYHGLITTGKRIKDSGFNPSLTISLTNLSGSATGEQYIAIPFLTKTKVESYSLMGQHSAMTDIHSIDLPRYIFTVVTGGEWIRMDVLSASDYDHDTVTVRVRFTTYRILGYGNSNDGNSVILYNVTVKGKFGSDKGWDDDQIGEPVVTIPDLSLQSPTYVTIPCRSGSSASGSYVDITFTLDNTTSGTGAQTHPLRGVLISARCYHSGNTAQGASAGSWNNTSMPHDDAGSNVRLQPATT